MSLKTCFGLVAIALTIIGIAGIFTSGVVGLIWGPICLIGDVKLQKQMNCRDVVRSEQISMALIVCGCMVLSLTVGIVWIEIRTQCNKRSPPENLLGGSNTMASFLPYYDSPKIRDLMDEDTNQTFSLRDNHVTCTANKNEPSDHNLIDTSNQEVVIVPPVKVSANTRKPLRIQQLVSEEIHVGEFSSEHSTPNSSHFKFADDIVC